MTTTADTTWAVTEARWKRAWTRTDRSVDTLDTYFRDVKRFLKWCETEGHQSASLEAADLYIGHLEQSKTKSVARMAARALRAYGDYLAAEYEQVSPYAKLKLPREPVPTRANTATDDDLARLLAACKPSDSVTARAWEPIRDRAIITVMAFTGMRRGEVANMMMDDLDLVGSTLRIPKTKTRVPRHIWLHPDAVGAILRYLKAVEADRAHARHPDALWLSTYQLTKLEPNGVGQILYRRGKAAHVDTRAHAFRRMHAGKWMAAAGSETGLMQNSGWSSTTMIQRYTKDVASANSRAEAQRLFDR